MAEKIEDLRERSMVMKRNRECLLLEGSREDVVKIARYEEKLQELLYKTRQLQGENMLKEKVIS